MDRTWVFFRAKDDNRADLLKQMHNGGGFSESSHLVDLSRPTNDVALPVVFFHTNGDAQVGWRELFASVTAEEKYRYRTGRISGNFQVNQNLSRNAFTDDQTQVIEEHASIILTYRGMRASMVEQGFREAEIFESYINKATQAEAPRACVSHGNYTDLK